MLGNINFYDQKTKYIATFVATFIAFFLLAPGNFIEIDPTSDKKCKTNRTTTVSTVATHGLIFSLLVLAWYYFYLNKSNKVSAFI